MTISTCYFNIAESRIMFASREQIYCKKSLKIQTTIVSESKLKTNLPEQSVTLT